MMFELVKNSLRAVQERFMDSDKHAPPVRIIVADGAEDVTIKVCLSPGLQLENSFCEPTTFHAYKSLPFTVVSV
jgi:hypothetical protein